VTTPSDTPDRLAGNLRAVEQRLTRAAAAAGRTRDELTLVAVSKTRPANDVAALAALGVCDFGESRWQELGPKQEQLAASAPGLPAPGLRWHFLGRLQRNKARAVGAAVAVVHSLDREDLCGPLSRGAAAAGSTLDVFVQVSLDGDPDRGGAPVEVLDRLVDLVADTPHLRLCGLMAVPPQDVPARAAFARLRAVSERVRERHPDARALSAGMSGDVEDAIAEGATHLRIGTALFGPRA
jgi:pyridoxal phosphate enzyme (YggS family)